MTRPILTNRQLKKLDEVYYIICEFPPMKGGECVRVNAKTLFVSYSPTLAGTPIKNISTRLRDFWDFVRWCASKMPQSYMVLIRINDENIDSYSDYLKSELNNNKNTTLVKMSHIRAVFKWAEKNWDPQNERREKGMIGRAWKYKPRGKPFQKKEKGSKPTLPTVDPRKCLPYIEEQPQPKPQTTKKRGNPFRKTFLYDLLGVAPTATTEEIKRGYKKRMVAIHPDHNTNDGGNYKNLSQGINLAFEYLSRHRADYAGYCATTKGFEEAAYTCKEIYALVGGYPSLYKLENRI